MRRMQRLPELGVLPQAVAVATNRDVGAQDRRAEAIEAPTRAFRRRQVERVVPGRGAGPFRRIRVGPPSAASGY